ncbi:hypothetical protein BU26DRAFT_561833 [Trematosphaeria pertusa]|uniref:Uncharacterized protein n=1 Tax=Trematosphaeria pertusa TaxID=390896 RepID=A0A6A6INU2_9PLEO|nr:uncharacterized protein BU26DRAFT_561833 [Trematosphaeria pertusa]KAF2252056.1 hypothetical protein BU26DRAFT_561833 [Trematosphaeria pertusa]
MHPLLAFFQSHLLTLANYGADIETSVLHIPPTFRFFSQNAAPERQCIEATMLLAAPFHAFVTIPVLDWLLGPAGGNIGGTRTALVC